MVKAGRQSAGRGDGQPAARAVALILLAVLGTLVSCTTIQPGTKPEYTPPLPVLERGTQPVVRVAPESPDVRQVSSYQPRERDRQSRPGYRHPAGNTRIKELLFQNVPLVIAAELLTEAGWTNMMLHGPVADKNVRLYLRDVTLATAVEALLRGNELWYRSENGITAVMSEQAFADSMVFQRSEKIQAFFLRYTNAQDMAAMLATLLGEDVDLKVVSGQEVYGHLEAREVGASAAAEGDAEEVLTEEERRLLVKLGEAETVQAIEDASAAVGRRTPTTISVFRKNNAIIVRSTEEAVLRHITGLIRELDTPTQQVLLEVRIVQLDLGDAFDSFFDVRFNDGTWSIGTLGGTSELDSDTQAVVFSKENVEARLQLFANENRLDTIATPFLMSADNAAVRFFVGEQIPLRTGVSKETVRSADLEDLVFFLPEVENREIGTELDIKSFINADGTITLEMVVSIETPNLEVSTIPLVNDRTGEVLNFPLDGVDANELRAILAVPGGDTVALGGFIRLQNQDVEQKVPLLGDIPGAGYLFKKVERRAARTETVILITPHVMGHPREGTDTTERFMNRASQVRPQLERQQERIDQAKNRERWPRVAPGDENPFLQDF